MRSRSHSAAFWVIATRAVEVALDEDLGQRVGHLRGELAVVGDEADLRELAVAHELDLQVASELRRTTRLRTCSSVLGGLGLEEVRGQPDPRAARLRLARIVVGWVASFSFCDDLARELLALEDLDLRLVVLALDEALVVDLLDRDDLGLALLDQQRHRAAVGRAHREDHQRREDRDQRA